jgi:hypothetical protein
MLTLAALFGALSSLLTAAYIILYNQGMLMADPTTKMMPANQE